MLVTLDAAAIAAPLIRHYESCQRHLNDGRIGPYADACGTPTIGWGNTRWEDGRCVTLHDAPISQAQADALFLHWLQHFEAQVAALAPTASPSELAAFTSLAYNIGVGAFAASSALRQFKVGNKHAAGYAFELWDRCRGVVLKGLQRRRRAEHYVFDGRAVADAVRQAEQDYP